MPRHILKNEKMKAIPYKHPGRKQRKPIPKNQNTNFRAKKTKLLSDIPATLKHQMRVPQHLQAFNSRKPFDPQDIHNLEIY